MIKEQDASNTSKDMDLLKKQVARLTTMLKDKDDKIKSLSSELNTLRGDSLEDSLKKKDFDEYKPDDVNKEIVKLYAHGYSSGFIYITLNEKKGKNVSLQEIEDIVYGINHDPYSLDIKLIEYYNECVKIFEDQKLSKGLFANGILSTIKYLQDRYSVIQLQASENGDYKEERMILDSMKSLEFDKAKIFSKNVLGIFENGVAKGDDYGEDYKKLKEQYEANNSDNKKIIKIKKAK